MTEKLFDSFEEWLFMTAKDGDELVVRIFLGAKQVRLTNQTRNVAIVSHHLEDLPAGTPTLEPELRRVSFAVIEHQTPFRTRRFRCPKCETISVESYCKRCDRLTVRA